MGIHDRHYQRADHYGGGGGGGGDFVQSLLAFMNKSFNVGRVAGIRIRVHITFLFIFVLYMITDGSFAAAARGDWLGAVWTPMWLIMLFGSVLLHEFGHCFGCRSVGGRADDILMWPLGGLASCAPPNTIWAHFVTVVCGPLVNVVLGGLAYGALFLWLGDGSPARLWPLTLYQWTPEVAALAPASGFFAEVLTSIYVVNYALFLFNVLLIFYPFDGGRLVQIALWKGVGFYKSMLMATTFGIVGAIGVAVFGFANGNGLLMVIGAFGGYTCYQQRKMILHAGPSINMNFGGGGRSSEFSYASEPEKQSYFERRAARKAQQAAEREATKKATLEREIDRVLDKVHTQGLGSLSEREKKILREGTDQKRRGA